MLRSIAFYSVILNALCGAVMLVLDDLKGLSRLIRYLGKNLT